MRARMNNLHASLTAWFAPLVGPISADRMAAAVITDGDRAVARRLGHPPTAQDRWHRRLDYSPSRWMVTHTPMTAALLGVGRTVLLHTLAHPDDDPDDVWNGVLAERVRLGRTHLPPYADGRTAKGRDLGYRPRARFDAIRRDLTDPIDLYDDVYGFR